MNINRATLVLAGFATLTALAQPGVASGAEIKILCSNGIKAVMEEDKVISTWTLELTAGK